MMVKVLWLAWLEWFKLRRRLMPWVLLVILLLFTQLAVWGSFFAYERQQSNMGSLVLGGGGVFGQRGGVRIDCNAVLRGDLSSLPSSLEPVIGLGAVQQCNQLIQRQRQALGELYKSFTLPGSISRAMEMVPVIGMILLVILTASTVGVEYGWGTLRTVLVRGPGRWQFLAGKVILLAVLSLAALAIVVAATSASSLVTQSLVGPDALAPATLPTWQDVGIASIKAWYSLLPFLALTAFVTVATGSSASGIAIGLAYFFGEQIVVAILLNLFDWFDTLAQYLLEWNVTAWGGGLSLAAGRADPPSDTHAFFVLLAYTIVLGGLAFWFFARRDVTGPRGG